jgi:hypothetical protein
VLAAQPAAKEETGPERITIDRAVKAFTAEFEEHAASQHSKKYRLLLAKRMPSPTAAVTLCSTSGLPLPYGDALRSVRQPADGC